MNDLVKALIFDLDNCIAPAKAVGEDLYAPVFAAMREENRGRFDEGELAHIFFEIWRHPLDWVAKEYGFTDRMFQLAWDHFRELEVASPMNGYGDLDEIAKLLQDKYLVTSGFSRLQKSKVKNLGLELYFDQIFIDEIDSENRIGKEGLFSSILTRFDYSKDDVVVIGDNADSEILAGHRMGLITVQTLRSEVPRSDLADFHINTFSELGEVISVINRTV